ncbi:beta-ketoacyl synthase chain length factor [Chryseolinea sp. T2]|uniref:beta-ketoacyl synthase chain length factor n=1 Tax=Chryseolinea sp. T2 TaxID=3129255 RepID=UPI0030768BFB
MQGKAHIYINGTACISPQRTFDGFALNDPVNYTSNVLTCVTPDFKAYLPAAQLRRLGRMLRVGLTTSIICLRNSGVTAPDGIITATGYGFLEDTERFLREIIERKERQLTPTHFMQGTYNALAGIVGLSLHCTGYNNTYVSKGYALGSALDDAIIQIRDAAELNLLVGAYDEAVSVQYKSVARDGHFKKEQIDSLKLFEHQTQGSLQGEGAAFFLLSGIQTAQTICRLTGHYGLFQPSADELKNELESFLSSHNTSLAELDLWIAGFSGDVDRDQNLRALAEGTLSSIPQARFKHLTGEYCTADGFALWLGANIVKSQSVPASIMTPPSRTPGRIKKVLIVNHYLDRNYNFFLLDRPKS